MSHIIYLDNNATTKVDPRVLATMMPFLTEEYANAASTHPFGVKAYEAVKNARSQIADLLTAKPTKSFLLQVQQKPSILPLKELLQTIRIKENIL